MTNSTALKYLFVHDMDSSLSIKQSQPETSTDSYPKFIRITKTKETVNTRSTIPVSLPSTIEAITPLQMLQRPIISRSLVFGSSPVSELEIVDIAYAIDLLRSYSEYLSCDFAHMYQSARMTVRFIYEWSESPAYAGKVLIATHPPVYQVAFGRAQNVINRLIALGATVIKPSKACSLIIDIPIHSPLGAVPLSIKTFSVGTSPGVVLPVAISRWVSEIISYATQNVIATQSAGKTFTIHRRLLFSEFVPIYPV